MSASDSQGDAGLLSSSDVTRTGASRSELFERLVRAMHCAESPGAVLNLFLGLLRDSFGPVCYVELVLDGVAPGRFAVTRMRTDEGLEVVPDRSPFLIDGATTGHRGLFGRIVNGPAKPVVEYELAISADDPFGRELAVYRAMIAMPIYTAGHPEWVVVLARDARAFEHAQMDDFMLRVNLVGAMLAAMSTATRLEEAQAQMRAEVQRIAKIQRQLLPAGPPAVKDLEIAFSVTTSAEAGGDFVDFREVGSGDLGMIIADASGHGPSAAVVAAMVSVMIRAYAPLPEEAGKQHGKGRGEFGGGDEPWERGMGEDEEAEGAIPGRIARVLAFANGHLCEKRIEESFVTAFVAGWDSDTRTLEYARAGHPPPMLRVAATGEIREIRDAAGLPLGIMPDEVYTSAQVVLGSGDLLLAYTDGIAEAQNAAGEQFGEARIAAVLAGVRTAQEALDQVTAAVKAFVGEMPAGDDQSLLAVRVL